MRPRVAVPPLCLLALLVALSACSKEKEAPAAPAPSAPAAAAVAVTSVTVGRSVDAGNRIADPVDVLGTQDTIYVSVVTTGTDSDAELRARWTFEDGQVVDESTRRIAPTGEAATEFHVQKPGGWPPGRYKVEIFLDGATAGSKEFRVE